MLKVLHMSIVILFLVQVSACVIPKPYSTDYINLNSTSWIVHLNMNKSETVHYQKIWEIYLRSSSTSDYIKKFEEAKANTILRVDINANRGFIDSHIYVGEEENTSTEFKTISVSYLTSERMRSVLSTCNKTHKSFVADLSMSNYGVADGTNVFLFFKYKQKRKVILIYAPFVSTSMNKLLVQAGRQPLNIDITPQFKRITDCIMMLNNA